MKMLTTFANLIFLCLLAFFSIALPFGTWILNPAWIVLFARVYNFAFLNIHFTSVAAISIVCTYLIVRDRATVQPFKWVAVVFAGAGVHEWMLFLWNWLLSKTPITSFWQDAVWFAAFIALGILFGNRKQRIVLGVLAAYLFVLMGVYVSAFHNSDLEIGSYGMRAVSDNFIEVFGWVTTALGFLFA